MESEFFSNRKFLIKKELSPSVKLFLEKYGDEEITSIEINKKPINIFIHFFLNICSNYKLMQNMKKLNYDKIFHLKMNIKTKNGTYFSLEKEDTIKIEYYPPYDAESKRFSIPIIPNNLTTNKMIAKTQELIGNKIFEYSIKYYNCQDFIIDLLKVNEINSGTIFDFIKQDSTKLLEDIEILLLIEDILICSYYVIKSFCCLLNKYWFEIISYLIYIFGCIYIFIDFFILIRIVLFS